MCFPNVSNRIFEKQYIQWQDDGKQTPFVSGLLA